MKNKRWFAVPALAYGRNTKIAHYLTIYTHGVDGREAIRYLRSLGIVYQGVAVRLGSRYQPVLCSMAFDDSRATSLVCSRQKGSALHNRFYALHYQEQGFIFHTMRNGLLTMEREMAGLARTTVFGVRDIRCLAKHFSGPPLEPRNGRVFHQYKLN